MTITVDALRPKADPQTMIPLDIEWGTVVEDDAIDSFFNPVSAIGLDILDYIVTDVQVTTGSDILTTINGGFADVRVGDSFAAGSTIEAGTVIAVTDSNTIQISVSGTGSGLSPITFTPLNGGTAQAVTLFGIETSLIQTPGGAIKVSVIGHLYDGTLGSTPGDKTNATSTINLNEFNLNVDSIFTKARIPRIN